LADDIVTCSAWNLSYDLFVYRLRVIDLFTGLDVLNGPWSVPAPFLCYVGPPTLFFVRCDLVRCPTWTRSRARPLCFIDCGPVIAVLGPWEVSLTCTWACLLRRDKGLCSRSGSNILLPSLTVLLICDNGILYYDDTIASLSLQTRLAKTSTYGCIH